MHTAYGYIKTRVRLKSMDIYDSLLEAVRNEYDTVRLIKKSKRGQVSLVRHRESGTRYIFRHFYGSSEVYERQRRSGSPGSCARPYGYCTPWVWCTVM